MDLRTFTLSMQSTKPSPVAPWRVMRVDAKPGMKLHVQFADGTTGEVHMQPFLDSARVTGTIFEPLRDATLFAQARLDLGAVTWPNGADLAPDAMQHLVRLQLDGVRLVHPPPELLQALMAGDEEGFGEHEPGDNG